jgi:hypothetical protein
VEAAGESVSANASENDRVGGSHYVASTQLPAGFQGEPGAQQPRWPGQRGNALQVAEERAIHVSTFGPRRHAETRMAGRNAQDGESLFDRSATSDSWPPHKVKQTNRAVVQGEKMPWAGQTAPTVTSVASASRRVATICDSENRGFSNLDLPSSRRPYQLKQY